MNSILRTFSLALPLTLALAANATAQEWTRFRGPNGTGVSNCPGIPARWTESDVQWKTELPAGGHSSPVIWGDRVFLTGASDDGAERAVFAIDTRDGQVIWTKWYPSQPHSKHQFNSFASSTSAVDAERVYVSWTTPDEYTVKALTHDGQDVWSRNLGPFKSQHSGGMSPIVFEDLLIVGNEQDAEGGKSSWLALDCQTGETVWQLDRTSEVVSYSTPCVRRTADGSVELVFTSQPHGITGINPRTGSVNWELTGLFDKRTVSSPVLVADGELLVGTCGSGPGGNYVVAIHPGSKAEPDSAKLAYRITRQAPYVPTPIALGDLLFLWSDAGIVSCVDAKTGDVHWTKRIGGNYFGSPICIEDRLYCTDTAGTIVVLAASKEFEELARNPLGELCHSTPAVAGGRLYVRTFSHLYCIGDE